VTPLCLGRSLNSLPQRLMAMGLFKVLNSKTRRVNTLEDGRKAWDGLIPSLQQILIHIAQSLYLKPLRQ
jgi:hypothetical protein